MDSSLDGHCPNLRSLGQWTVRNCFALADTFLRVGVREEGGSTTTDSQEEGLRGTHIGVKRYVLPLSRPVVLRYTLPPSTRDHTHFFRNARA